MVKPMRRQALPRTWPTERLAVAAERLGVPLPRIAWCASQAPPSTKPFDLLPEGEAGWHARFADD
jgi:hypothetical protein